MEYKITINRTFKLTKQDIEDIIVTALEGGIGYWACLDNTSAEFENAPKDEPVSITAARILLNGGELILIDEEENEKYNLTLNKLLNGFKMWYENGYDRYGCISGYCLDFCNFDAICADGVIQFALFNDIVYG